MRAYHEKRFCKDCRAVVSHKIELGEPRWRHGAELRLEVAECLACGLEHVDERWRHAMSECEIGGLVLGHRE